MAKTWPFTCQAIAWPFARLVIASFHVYGLLFINNIRRIARLFPTVHLALNLRDAARNELDRNMERRYDYCVQHVGCGCFHLCCRHHSTLSIFFLEDKGKQVMKELQGSNSHFSTHVTRRGLVRPAINRSLVLQSLFHTYLKNGLACWTFLFIWRAQFQKAITPLFVKIELLVPMCSVTPLVSWKQFIFSKTLCLNNRYFWLYCVFFVKNC